MRQSQLARYVLSTQTHSARTHRRRPQLGAVSGMVAVCAFILVLVIVAVVQMSMKMSSSQMVRNSVDAGVLNIATHVPDLKSGTGGANFSDCNDKTGGIGLTNINRVWGKVLLINANAQEMAATGQAGLSSGSASTAMSGAEDLTTGLQSKLTDKDSMDKLFAVQDDKKRIVATKKGSGGGDSDESQFNTAYLHRGDESNISIDPSQFPGSTGDNLKPVNKGSGQWLSGYQNLTVNGKQFMFVPFRLGEMPHLVSPEEFQSNQQKPEGAIASLPPNSYHGTGTLAGTGGQAAASAIANPQHTYRLAIPYAYVVIRLEKNKASWKLNGQEIATSTYEFAPEQQWEIKNKSVGCQSTLNGYASLGNEYKQTDLLSVLTALPGKHEPAFKKILQRLKEIDPGMTSKSMKALLSGQQVVANEYEYVIYPTYKTADKIDPSLKISPQSQVSESWYKAAKPDGTEKTIVTEPQTQDKPNTDWAQIIGTWMMTSHIVKEDGDLMWTPGTGLNQCLGTLRLQRKVDITFAGHCP